MDIKHIAFIMDGNGRWAIQKGKLRKEGHRQGVYAMQRCVEACIKRGIHYITFYAFSTENWKRPEDEVKEIFSLVGRFADKNREYFKEHGINFETIGDLSRLDKKTLKIIDELKIGNNKVNPFSIIIALNYGGRDEIIRAIHKLKNNNLEITKENFESSLDTAGFPDPDIIVRTSGEKRLSGFLLYQSAYSELIFIDDYWPDFCDETLDRVINEFNRRVRRFGSV